MPRTRRRDGAPRIGGRPNQVVLAFSVSFALLLASSWSSPAYASAIVQPSTSPIVVAVVTAAPPPAVTVIASGFAPRSLVYVEQCDGVAPTAAQWSPTVHCDLGSSPSPAIADSRGLATFSATDRNRAFRPFDGESPQSLFNCLAPSQTPPSNALPNFTNCSLRVSTSNTATTADQSFRAIAFTTKSAATPSPTIGTTTTTTKPAKKAKKAKVPAGERSEARRGGGSTAADHGVSDSGRTAVVAAPRHPKVGLLSLTDADLATGYILVLSGLLVTAIAIALRRRDAAAPNRVTDSQTVGER